MSPCSAGNSLHANPEGFPVPALHEKSSVLRHDKIDTTISALTTGFDHRVALSTIRLTHEAFELTPSECSDRLEARLLIEESLRAPLL